MCGIYGFFSISSIHLNSTLENFASENAKRGPDSRGFLHQDNIFMGMYRLAITGIGNGQQPIFSRDGNVALICNGEIYNYKQLRSDLKRNNGCNFKTDTDVEVILQGYLTFGIEFFSKLSGMFAFAIFDKKINKLIVSRDKFGIKPLYHLDDEKGLFFSSTISSFKQLKCEISAENLTNQIIQGYSIGENTLLRNVKMMPPGTVHSYQVINQSIVKQVHRLSDYRTADQSAVRRGVNEIDTLRDLVVNAIKTTYTDTVRSAVFLSGGLDSSLIASIIVKEFGPNSIKAYICRFEGKSTSEFDSAIDLCKQLKMKYKIEEISAPKTFASLVELLQASDEPFSDSAVIPSAALSKLAAEEGIKVVYSGAGADELFSGYERHFPGIKNRASFIAHHKILRSIFKFQNLRPDWKVRFSSFETAYLNSITSHNYFLLDQLLGREINLIKKLKDYSELYYGSVVSEEAGREHDFQHYLVDNILRFTDQATMNFGIEGRFPFLNENLKSFLDENPHLKEQRDRISKPWLRLIANEFLPDFQKNQKKLGFNSPVNFWIQNFLKNEFDELYNFLDVGLSGVVKREKLAPFLRSINPSDGQTLFSLIVLANWLKKY